MLSKAVVPLTITAMGFSGFLFFFATFGILISNHKRSCPIIVYLWLAGALILAQLSFSVVALVDKSALTRIEGDTSRAVGSGGGAQKDVNELEKFLEDHGRYIAFGYLGVSIVLIGAFVSAFSYRGEILDERAREYYNSLPGMDTKLDLEAQRQRNALLNDDYGKAARVYGPRGISRPVHSDVAGRC